jgi:hypothetical protein
VAQGVGPEFKPQYHTHTHTRPSQCPEAEKWVPMTVLGALRFFGRTLPLGDPEEADRDGGSVL